jgi:hypothetical protein
MWPKRAVQGCGGVGSGSVIPKQCSIEADGCRDISECFVGLSGVKFESEMLTKRGELPVVRSRSLGVLVEKPDGPLHGASDLVASGEVEAQLLEPGLKEATVEGGVVGHELGNVVDFPFGREHGEGGMAAQKVGEPLGGLFGR